MLLREILIALLVLIPSLYLSQNTYYISPYGSDTNSGLSANDPWKTISKVNANIATGNTYLFEEGEVFTGQIEIPYIGLASYSPINFNSYPNTHGGGIDKPVISAIDTLDGVWISSVYPNIWELSDTIQIDYLRTNNNKCDKARFPNKGNLAYINYHQVSACPWGISNDKCSEANNLISDDLIGFSNGYFNGATLRLRTSNWSWESRKIQAHSVWTSGAGILNWSTNFNQDLFYNSKNSGWGFFIDNLFSELDTVNEFYYNDTTNTLYYYPVSGVDPNTLTFTTSLYDYGINTNNGVAGTRDILNIQNLKFTGQKKSAIRLEKPFNSIIKNCDFNQLESRAIIMEAGDANEVSSCMFSSINDGGCYLRSTNNLIADNNFKNIGMEPGYMEEIDFAEGGTCIDVRTCTWVGAPCNTVGSKILRNRIDSCGNRAISFRGSGYLIQHNYITNSLLLMDDGGSIYTYGFKNALDSVSFSRNSIVRDNILDNIPGGFYGKPRNEQYPVLAISLHLDHQVDSTQVIHNTVVKSGNYGQFLNTRGNDNKIDSNTYFGFGYNGIRADQIFINGSQNNFVTNNIFYGFDSTNLACVRVTGPSEAIQKDFVLFDNNFYATPFYYDSIVFSNGINSVSQNFKKYNDWLAWDPFDNLSSSVFDIQYPSGTNPNDIHQIFYNATLLTTSITLTKDYNDIYGNQVCSPLILNPFDSKILIEVGSIPCSTTGVDNEFINELMIYPNPATNQLSLKSSNQIEEIIIYSLEGKQVLKINKIKSNFISLDVSSLGKGTYLIKAGKEKVIQKFIKH